MPARSPAAHKHTWQNIQFQVEPEGNLSGLPQTRELTIALILGRMIFLSSCDGACT
jgi:hypothetical protein